MALETAEWYTWENEDLNQQAQFQLFGLCQLTLGPVGINMYTPMVLKVGNDIGNIYAGAIKLNWVLGMFCFHTLNFFVNNSG